MSEQQSFGSGARSRLRTVLFCDSSLWLRTAAAGYIRAYHDVSKTGKSSFVSRMDTSIVRTILTLAHNLKTSSSRKASKLQRRSNNRGTWVVNTDKAISGIARCRVVDAEEMQAAASVRKAA